MARSSLQEHGVILFHPTAQPFSWDKADSLISASTGDRNERVAMIEAGPDQLQALRDSGMSTDTLQRHMKFPSARLGAL